MSVISVNNTTPKIGQVYNHKIYGDVCITYKKNFKIKNSSVSQSKGSTREEVWYILSTYFGSMAEKSIFVQFLINMGTLTLDTEKKCKYRRPRIGDNIRFSQFEKLYMNQNEKELAEKTRVQKIIQNRQERAAGVQRLLKSKSEVGGTHRFDRGDVLRVDRAWAGRRASGINNKTWREEAKLDNVGIVILELCLNNTSEGDSRGADSLAGPYYLFRYGILSKNSWNKKIYRLSSLNKGWGLDEGKFKLLGRLPENILDNLITDNLQC